MKVLHAQCAGVDVHKQQVVGCARLQRGAKVRREQRRFETTTAGLLELQAWLEALGCTHVAMEATGVYWKPVWHILRAMSSCCWPTRRTCAMCPDASRT